MIDTQYPTQAKPTSAVNVQSRVRPNALIVGPMKAGTSWLYEYLKSHDEVVVPSGTKETFFFDQRFDNKSSDWYYSHFAPRHHGRTKRVLEVAPTYFHPANVPARVLETLGRIQIIVTLRDPAERAFSLFQHMRRYGFTSCTDFQDAVRSHAEILESSRYNESLHRWERTFGRENVSVLFMDDLRNDPLRFASDCCNALGITPPYDTSGFPSKVNEAAEAGNYYVAKLTRLGGDLLRSFRLYRVVDAAKRLGLKKLVYGKPQTVRQSITPEERSWFLDQIKLDLCALQRRFDRDLSHWLGKE